MTGGSSGFLGFKKARKKKEDDELRRKQAEEQLRVKEERDGRYLIENKIRDCLWKAVKNIEKEHLRFICAQDLEKVWTLPCIAQLSKGLDWSNHELQARAQRDFLKIMSTLIWIKWDYWHEFRSLFLEHRDRTDEQLPFKDTSFLQTEELRTSFRDQQYLFNPVVIREDDEDAPDHYSEKYSEKHRMPFVETKPIGEGGSGIVTKELIPPGYLKYRTGEVNSAPLVIARKRIRASGGMDEASFLTEQKSLKSFKRCLEGNSNIMLSYTSFAHGPDFTIISPLADLDLHTFFHGTYNDFQYRSQGFTPLHLLYGASCLAGALKFLHEGLRQRGIAGKIYCAHLDLKPENILVVWGKGNVEPAGRWLVHDFGTSKIKGASSSSQTLAPGDFLSRHFSYTQPRRAPGPFQAPEVRKSNERVVGRESDIWSLGCILTVVLAFACGGPSYVKSFVQARTQRECADDYFYSMKDDRVVLKDGVIRWLESLNTGRRGETWITETVALIYSTLVERPSKRQSAGFVQGTLDEILSQPIGSLRNVCSWVPKELSCESTRAARPIERLHIPTPAAEITERRRSSESPTDIRGSVVARPYIEPGLEVVQSQQLPSPFTPSTGQFSPQFGSSYGTDGLRASDSPKSRSSSLSALPLRFTNDATFMKLEVPKDAFKSVMCPSACHVIFLSKKRASIVRLGNEGTWIANRKPPKIETDSRTRSLSCPDNWEWDFASMAGVYLVLRSRKQGGRERKVHRYKCAEYGYVWEAEPMLDTERVPLSTALDIVVSTLGDVLFIHDEHLWYYCSRESVLIELFTQGQHRAASACFSPNGQWIFGWSHESGCNNFYKWDTTQWARVVSNDSSGTLKEEWNIRTPHNTPQRGPGAGNPAIFPFLDYFVAFNRPQHVYIIGKNASKPNAVLVQKAYRDIVSGVCIQGNEGTRRVESLILLQNDKPGFLMTLSMIHDGAIPMSADFKLQYQFTAGSDAVAVLNIDSKFYVVISHADGRLERRRVSST